MPTTTESGPVRTRARRRCKSWTKHRNSHTRWTRSRGLHRLTSTVGAVPTTAEVDGQDRLTRHGATTYTYNDDGELDTATTAAAVTDYDYNELSQLTHVLLPNGTQLDYRYDGEGRRISKAVNGTVTQRLLYGQGRRPIAELDATGAVISTFTYAGDSVLPDLITKTAGNVTYRVIGDHQNNPRLIVNSTTGAIAQRMDFDAWGNLTQDTNPGFQPFGYTGGLHDPDTGLVHLDARDYDPRTGRFTSKDPIGFAGGLANLYSYVGNDPVNFGDPSGLGAMDWVHRALDKPAQAFMGAADAFSFGGTEWVRNKAGLGNTVDYCSGWRKWGGFGADFNPKGLAKNLGKKAFGRFLKREGDDAAGQVVKTTCNCFPAGTPVATVNGPKPIEKIQVGDQVWAHDLGTGRSELRTVSGLFHKQATELLTLTIDDTVIQVTPDHPFYAPGRGWVLSGHLKIGDELLRRDGRSATVDSIVRREGGVTVYNFEVAGDHNYFISAVQLLVHNCAMPGHDSTPSGREYSAHYLNDTGPTRNIPGSILDEAIDHGSVAKDLPDRTVFYDPNNDITVVLSKTTGKIMSARRGSL